MTSNLQPTHLTDGLRGIAEQIRESTSPAEVAALIQEITRDGGTLEALSDVVATASRWVKDRPGGGYLWQPLGRAADEVWEAGTDLADLPARIRDLPTNPARIRSATLRPGTGALPAAAPGQPPPASAHRAR